MNPKPSSCCAYTPTKYEHYANVLTHGVRSNYNNGFLSIFFSLESLYLYFKSVIVPSIVGAYYLHAYSKTHEQSKSCLLYGISLVLLFTISTLFHLFSMIRRLRLVEN